MTREQILSSRVKSEAVDVPDWGGRLNVVELDGVERVTFFDQVAAARETSSATRLGVLLLCHCLRDDAGNRILQDDDAESLERKGGVLLNQLCAIANRLNAIGEEVSLGKK